MQLAFESELAKKREEDAAYEDVTEVSIFSFLFDIVVFCYFIMLKIYSIYIF